MQARALAAEQDAGVAAGRDLRRASRAAASGADHRLGLIVGARGGREQQRAVGDRRLDGVEQLDLVEDVVGAAAARCARNIGPAVARLDDAQPRQPEIAHGARRHADVLAELRLDQNHGRAAMLVAVLVLSVRPDIALHFLDSGFESLIQRQKAALWIALLRAFSQAK